MDYTVYISATGKIVRTGTAPLSLISRQPQSSESVLHQPSNVFTDYVFNAAVTPRPTNPATIDKMTVTANGNEVVTLSSIPSNSVISIRGDGVNLTQTVQGTTETVDFDTPGSYLIRIEAFPYLDYEVTVNAN